MGLDRKRNSATATVLSAFSAFQRDDVTISGSEEGAVKRVRSVAQPFDQTSRANTTRSYGVALYSCNYKLIA